jgi:hypothetical protein
LRVYILIILLGCFGNTFSQEEDSIIKEPIKVNNAKNKGYYSVNNRKFFIIGNNEGATKKDNDSIEEIESIQIIEKTSENVDTIKSTEVFESYDTSTIKSTIKYELFNGEMWMYTDDENYYNTVDGEETVVDYEEVVVEKDEIIIEVEKETLKVHYLDKKKSFNYKQSNDFDKIKPSRDSKKTKPMECYKFKK